MKGRGVYVIEASILGYGWISLMNIENTVVGILICNPYASANFPLYRNSGDPSIMYMAGSHGTRRLQLSPHRFGHNYVTTVGRKGAIMQQLFDSLVSKVTKD